MNQNIEPVIREVEKAVVGKRPVVEKVLMALLEAMEERQVTVDGEIHPLRAPFCVIATQNQVGAAGTQPLPHALR